MEAAGERGLMLKMNLPADPKEIFTIEEHWDWGSSLGSTCTHEFYERRPTYKESELLDFENMTKNLQTALQSSARFVLPGGKQFFYKNPVFNNYGDLMIEA